MRAIATRRPRRRLLQLTPLLISCTALFLALDGPSWAGGLIGPGQIKDDAIRSRHINDRAVKSAHIANGGVGSRDLGSASVGSDEIAPGAVAAGELADGSVNASKLAALVVRRNDVPLPDNSITGAKAECAAGERLVSGGVAPLALADDLSVYSSGPGINNSPIPTDGQTPTQWFGFIHNAAGGIGTVTMAVWAVCVR